MEIQPKQKLYIILGLAGLVIIGSVFFIGLKPQIFPHQPANPFPECQLLDGSCLDKNCKYLFMCDIMEFTGCQVYDCSSDYGVFIESKEGKTITKKYPKPNLAKAEEQIAGCQGEPVLLEQKCKNDKLELKVKLTTRGDCPINSFIVKLNNENHIAKFEKLEDYYSLTLDACGVVAVSDITAVGQGGIRIKSWR